MAKKADNGEEAPQTSEVPAETVAPANPKIGDSTAQAVDADQSQQEIAESEPFAEEANLPVLDPVSWQGAEFVHHEKTPTWYMGLTLTTVIIAGLLFLITREPVSLIVAIVAGILMGTYANRKPRQLDYTVDNSGLTIGPKHYSFQDFKSFSVAPETSLTSIVFMPLKRFAPSITIYFSHDIEEKVANIVSAQLPFEQHKLDAVDKLMKQIRF